jgi:hypothetical protein
MVILEQIEKRLQNLDKHIVGFADNVAQRRIDLLLSTLQLLGIRDYLPKGQANPILTQLENIEDNR